ncbi:hypothetical protein NDU88_002080 [Pleurodeles waltl]|uniref:Secreted protein n=1 Tax=Pleurodeles waltl TaxID=8319 RepID=A0AAV7KSJ7_PLEWA|nr:hypothetical protein NDU88_002080 [Pleurodeles waltl]
MCAVRVAAVCTLVRVAAWHSAVSFHFSRAPGLNLPLPDLDSAARMGSSPPMVGCTCSAPIALDLRPRTGSPLSILAGPEHLPPAVGTPGSQSHRARARTATLVPGHGVGRLATVASFLFHFKRAPSGAQGSMPGSSSGLLLHTGSGDARVKAWPAPPVFASPGLLGSVSLYWASAAPRAGILLSFLTSW